MEFVAGLELALKWEIAGKRSGGKGLRISEKSEGLQIHSSTSIQKS